jgi:acyl-CoA thioesterase FadM
MPRIKIDLPSGFAFTSVIPVRITDLNYGNHVGNDTILSLIHEARAQYLYHLGYNELDFAGTGLIMSDAGIEYKAELYYGDLVKVYVTAGDFSRIGFDVYYKFEKEVNGKTVLVTVAKTGMVCFDFEKRKVTSLPAEARAKLEAK